MQRLIAYLQNLIAIHDCVIIPSFGAIIKESVPPFYNESERVCYPGRDRFYFRPEITERDGLLDATFSYSYGMSLRRARIMVDKEVEQLKDVLYSVGRVQMGALGEFSTQNDGKILFTPSINLPSLGSGNFYGLLACPLPGLKVDYSAIYEPIPHPQAKVIPFSNIVKPLPKNRYFHFRIHKGLASGIAAGVLAIVLAVSVPSTNSLNKPYTAGFTQVGPFAEVSNKAPEGYDTPSSNVSVSPNENTVVPQVEIEHNVEYFVVVASFRTKQAVERYIASLPKQNPLGENIKYLRYKERYLAYAYATEAKDEAEQKARELRSNFSEHSSAWVLHQQPSE